MEILVIAPNLKRRLSGVTATIARLVPVQARSIGIVATGPGLPAGVPHVPLWRAATLPRDRWRVWHARRNTEMLLGLILARLLRRRFRLLFTSASQRSHSGWTKWLIRQMDGVVATSAKGAAYLEREADVILHGIDTATFRPADKAALHGRLGLPQGPLIGCFGRIRASKGTDHFVDAMIDLLPARAGTAIVMGRAVDKDRPFLDDLKARVAAAGLEARILFKPEVSVDRMPDWYAALDLYVAPQRWEGFGLTPLEAMACGVPVVATRVGAFEELVGPEAGLLVPPDDLPALRAAIAQMLDDPSLPRMAEAARSRVENGFRIEDEAEALIAVYRRMLS
ncbi:glycosyltransferase family 4 protein [Falsirhodobacter deserti]|uniref:glycosyltransferase family 4 protein n=1 Tax=Falsirhodobacter deserti TaxID=1365611 RepID=UPI000FE2B045|nr:glycosyltransferase family 4 protein [Falsirhodobacter deserti]